MRSLTKNLVSFLKAEDGPTAVEYAVMLVLVALAVMALGTGIAGSVTGVFGRVVTALAAPAA